MNGLKIGAAALFLLALCPAFARADETSTDAVEMFDKYCFTPSADRSVAINTIPDDGVNAKVIPAKQVEADLGAPGGIAWYVRSAHKLLFKLQFTPNNICSVEVPKVETAELTKTMVTFLDGKKKSEGVKFHVQDDNAADEGGLHQHRIFYMVGQPKAGTAGFLAVTTLDGGQLDEHRGQLSFILTSDPYTEGK